MIRLLDVIEDGHPAATSQWKVVRYPERFVIELVKRPLATGKAAGQGGGVLGFT